MSSSSRPRQPLTRQEKRDRRLAAIISRSVAKAVSDVFENASKSSEESRTLTPKDSNKATFSFKQFKACGPKEFTGEDGPTALFHWFDSVEVTLRQSGCPDHLRTLNATGVFQSRGWDHLRISPFLFDDRNIREEIEMASNGNVSGVTPKSASAGRNGLPKITTHKKQNEICHDDSSAPVKAQTIDELHSLQRKKSAPTTPLDGVQGAFANFAEEERHRQQLQSISASLASLTRETGPNLVKGDPTRKPETPRVQHAPDHYVAPTFSASDSSLKSTHVLHNLSPAELYEQAIKYEQGSFITSTGALATLSGAKTGRSPKDKRVVRDDVTEDELWWGKGSPNIEMDEHTFLVNRERAVDYLNSLEKVFVNDQFLNWDPENRIKVRIVSARAYHSLFMHNMCIRPSPEELESFGTPDFTIYNAGQFPCNRYTHYMTSSTSIDLNLGRREMVILGTQYAGEMKKGLFGVMHYLMPLRQILSLHSGCNMGKDGDVALFFGLSGTGKTTLSTDHNRYLIGDDEHCWSDKGVSNIEGGCYAKCIDLSREKEPDIWNAIKFGTVLENVVFDEHTREVDYLDKSVTENTRAAYPIEYIPNAKIPCVGPHPKNVILLACDAFGVLPPVSKLSLAQTMYHFISGYTALVAGTEEGVKEPRATFSACFGAAFIMLHPTRYAAMLATKMEKHGATGWLVNTGWSGGSYGSGSRMKLAYTRKIIDAIHSGSLLSANYKKTEVFGLEIPTEVEGVPSEILDPVNTWSDKKAYKDTLLKLGGLFKNNFEVFVNHKIGKDDKLTEEILAAGPNF
ncbi:putative carboxy-lyase [Helianthus annuus]|nr:putative carboxy-lyase [Helianthus annuus]